MNNELRKTNWKPQRETSKFSLPYTPLNKKVIRKNWMTSDATALQIVAYD